MGVMQQVLDDGTATAVLTSTGVIRSANPIFHEVFGLASIQGGEAAGKNFKALLNGNMGAQVDEILAKVGAGGEEVERSMEGRTKAGKVFPISCLFQQDRTSPGGGVIVKVVALNDNVGIITIDEMGSIEHANTFITRIFGYKTEECAAGARTSARIYPICASTWFPVPRLCLISCESQLRRLSSMNISQLMPRPCAQKRPSPTAHAAPKPLGWRFPRPASLCPTCTLRTLPD